MRRCPAKDSQYRTGKLKVHRENRHICLLIIISFCCEIQLFGWLFVVDSSMKCYVHTNVYDRTIRYMETSHTDMDA